MNPVDPLTARQLNRAVHDAAEAAKIDKRVTLHTLRHSFATHLLERKVDTGSPTRQASQEAKDIAAKYGLECPAS